MANKLLWYLGDGKYLEGDEAFNYMKKKQETINKAIIAINKLIKEMSTFNTYKTIIGDEDNYQDYFSKKHIFNTLCTSCENLLTVSMFAEEIIEKISEVTKID